MGKRGCTLGSKSQKIVYNVNNYFIAEADNLGPLRDIHHVEERVADALKMSIRSVKKILQRVHENIEDDDEISSCKSQPGISAASINIDNYIFTIWSVLYEMYTTKQRITVKSLLKILQDRNINDFSVDSLENSLKLIGFTLKNDTNKKALMEEENITLSRINFLREYINAIQHYDVVFLDKTWLFSKGCIGVIRKGDPTRVKRKPTDGTRYVILNAGNKNGFIPESSLIYASTRNTGDHHEDLDANTFENWLENTLLPHLEGPSLIIIENASYNSRIKNPVPTTSWQKRDMVDYLNELGIEVDDSLLNVELLELAKDQSPQRVYIVDELVNANGHKILRLPTKHTHFNAIHMVWSECKRYYDTHMEKHSQVFDVWQRALDSVSSKNWSTYINHTENIIKETWDRENMVDSMDSEPLMIQIEDDSGSESTSESESETNILYSILTSSIHEKITKAMLT